MTKSVSITPTKSEAAMLMPVIGIFALYLGHVIWNIPVIREMWKVLYNCKIDSCSDIAAIASIIGTLFVVMTLVITIIYSNMRGEQNRKQMNLMDGQIGLLVQSNRMAIVKEHMIELSLNIYSKISDDYYGSGVFQTSDKNGIILKWHTNQTGPLFDYRLSAYFRFYSSEAENANEILKREGWWRFIINVTRLKNGDYIMTGSIHRVDRHFHIEKLFQDMNEDEFNSMMAAISFLCVVEKDFLVNLESRVSKL